MFHLSKYQIQSARAHAGTMEGNSNGLGRSCGRMEVVDGKKNNREKLGFFAINREVSALSVNEADSVSYCPNTDQKVSGRFSRFVAFWLTIVFVWLFGIASFGQTILTSGTSQTYTVPAGVTSISVQCWGGGVAGAGDATSGNIGNGGGGGGAYANVNSYSVTPATCYPVTVGAGGSAGNANNGPGGAAGDMAITTDGIKHTVRNLSVPTLNSIDTSSTALSESSQGSMTGISIKADVHTSPNKITTTGTNNSPVCDCVTFMPVASLAGDNPVMIGERKNCE